LHAVLSRIFLAVAIISTIAFIYSGHYYLAADVKDVRVVDIEAKLSEIGKALFSQDGAIVYGVSIGPSSLSAINMGFIDVTLNASGDLFVWSAPRSALVIKGFEIYCKPDTAVSVNKNDYLQLYNEGGILYVVPKVILEYSANASSLGGHKIHWVKATSCIFTALNVSGTFDLLKTGGRIFCRKFERPCLFDTIVEVSFENRAILSFQAKKGEVFIFEGCISAAEISYQKR